MAEALQDKLKSLQAEKRAVDAQIKGMRPSGGKGKGAGVAPGYGQGFGSGVGIYGPGGRGEGRPQGFLDRLGAMGGLSGDRGAGSKRGRLDADVPSSDDAKRGRPGEAPAAAAAGSGDVAAASPEPAVIAPKAAVPPTRRDRRMFGALLGHLGQARKEAARDEKKLETRKKVEEVRARVCACVRALDNTAGAGGAGS